jgi:hypothetical protein
MIYRWETVLQIKIQELANLFLTVGSGTYCQMSDTVNCRLASFIPSILVNISPSSSESGSISQSNKITMRLQIFIRNTGFYCAFPHFIYSYCNDHWSKVLMLISQTSPKFDGYPSITELPTHLSNLEFILTKPKWEFAEQVSFLI